MSSDGRDSLTPEQRECVRLDFSGLNVSQLSEHFGKSRNTIYKWQSLGGYGDAMAIMQAEADKATVREVRKIRGESLRLLGTVLRECDARLTGGAMNSSEFAGVSRVILDTYKTTAAQTGLPEAASVQHSGKVEGGGVTVVISPDVMEQAEQAGD